MLEIRRPIIQEGMAGLGIAELVVHKAGTAPRPL